MQIDRSKWFYGGRFETVYYVSALFSSEANKFCCLGFLGCHIGLSQDNMNNICLPFKTEQVWPHKLFEKTSSIELYSEPKGTNWADVLAHINDLKKVHSDDRESWIKTGFKELLGIDVEFVGEYPE